MHPERKARTGRGEGAFSLVEVVVAVGIFGFGALALLGLLGMGMDAARDAEEEAVATMIARQVFEDLRLHANGTDAPPQAGTGLGQRPPRVLNAFLPARLPTRGADPAAASTAGTPADEGELWFTVFDRHGNPLPRKFDAEEEIAVSLAAEDFGEERVAQYVVTIKLRAHEQLEQSTRVEVVIETPANAPRVSSSGRTLRRDYQFVSVVTPGQG